MGSDDVEQAYLPCDAGQIVMLQENKGRQFLLGF